MDTTSSLKSLPQVTTVTATTSTSLTVTADPGQASLWQTSIRVRMRWVWVSVVSDIVIRCLTCSLDFAFLPGDHYQCRLYGHSHRHFLGSRHSHLDSPVQSKFCSLPSRDCRGLRAQQSPCGVTAELKAQTADGANGGVLSVA